MVAPQITVTFNPPLASDSGSVFDAKAFDTIGKLNPWGLEANDIAEYCGAQSNSALASAVAAAAGNLDEADRASFAGQAIGISTSTGNPIEGLGFEELVTSDTADALVAGDILYWDGTSLVRLPKGAEGQVLRQAAGDVPEWGSALSEHYDSGEQTITSGGQLTLAHGRGSTPLLVQVWLKCITAENGYSVGDLVAVNPATNNSATASNRGVAIVADDTNITVRFAANTSTFFVLDYATGNDANLTNANWRMIVKAWS